MAQASSDSSTVAALRVLVADDSKALRQRARTMLERAGLTVVDEAADGAEAVSMAAAHQPDVVLLDPRMPRGDGLEVAQALRRQQPGMQVVLWDWDGAQLDRAARRSGAQAAVPKDIRAAELVA